MTAGFSHGMGRRLSVVLAALHEPEVLLLDEPFDGVDPIGVEATLEVVHDARSRGACVLVSTHLRELAIEACSEVLVLRGGARVATMSRGRDGRRGGCACLPRPPRLRRPPGPRPTAPATLVAEARAPAPTSATCWPSAPAPCAAAGWPLALGVSRWSSPCSSRVLPQALPGAGTSGRALDAADPHARPPSPASCCWPSSRPSPPGGGRELLGREQAVAFPVSPTTDHLGALLLAPLNIAWILQAWLLLGSMAYATGRGRLLPAQVGMLLWLAAPPRSARPSPGSWSGCAGARTAC